MSLQTLQIGSGWFLERPGGLERFYYDLAGILPQVGVGFQGLVAGSDQVALTTDGKIQAFAPHDASLFRRWRGMRQWFQSSLRPSPDLIVSHFALYTLPLLDRLSQFPFVVHFHGPWALEGNLAGQKNHTTQLKLALEQQVYCRADHLIVLSQAFQDILHRQYKIPRHRIHVIPGGVDHARFDPPLTPSQARSQLGWASDRPILVTVRRLTPRMGLENLIEAIAHLLPQHPDLLLHIIGKGSLQPTLQAQIEALDFNDHVRLLGFVPDDQLGLIYRAASLSIVPTVAFEGFGLIILESLAAGTPVLATPIGGIPEILQPLTPELLLESSAPSDIAQGIHEALTGQRQIPDAPTCQHYVQEHYDWEAIAQQIKSVYQLAVC